MHFQEYVRKGISHQVIYSDLVYKLIKVRGSTYFIASGTKIVNLRRRRPYDTDITKKTIGLVLGSSTAICRLFPFHCTLANKAEMTTRRVLSKFPQGDRVPSFVLSNS